MNPEMPAFPFATASHVHNRGLTIRDYIAIEMAKSLIITERPQTHLLHGIEKYIVNTCRTAYKISDALTAESKKTNQ